MANNKVTNRSFYAGISIFLLMIILLTASPGMAAVTQPVVALTSDANGDGIAGIGDTITLTCRSNSASGTVYVTSQPSLGFTQLQLVQIASQLYSAIYTVSAGNVNSQIQFIFDDESGSVRSVTTGFKLNSKRPSANGRPTTNRGSCSDGTFRKNDNLTISFKLTSSNNGETMYADLSSLGLGYVDMGATGDTFACTVKMPANKEGTNISFPVTAMNEAGNAVTWTSAAINYDTISPVIQSATAVNMTANKQYVTVGDAIKVQAVISKWDQDIVTCANPSLFPGGPVVMERVSGDTVGANAVYEYIHYVTEENIANISTCFEIVATDKAENETKKNTNYIRLDTLPPEFSSLSITISEPVKGIMPNCAIIGDNLQIFGEMSSLMPDVTLSVDLSSIGGVKNQIIPFSDGSTSPKVATTSFRLNYTVGAYTSEHYSPRAFSVTAKDVAGNIITQVTMPVIYVDNLPPTISAGQFINVTNQNAPVKLGDQIAITAVVGNPDNGRVFVDISKLGGSKEAELSLHQGSTYRLDHIVSESVDPMKLGGIDQSLNFVVYAQDDGGNTVQTTTGSLLVDTEPPAILVATFTVNPKLSDTHQYVKIGDHITFRVQLASSEADIHDNEKVYMDLTSIGGDARTELIYGGGWYTYSCDVQEGNLNHDFSFSVTAVDNANNKVSRAIPVKIDNTKPEVGPIGINFLQDNPKTGVINIGDRIEIIVPVKNADEGYCFMDLSMIGSSSSCIIPYEKYDTALNRYYLVVDCAQASIENPSMVFTANVYDKAGNKMSGVSAPFVVDCRQPVINDFTVAHIKKKGKSNVINVGDQLKFTVDAEPSTFDNASVTINLSKVGGSSAQRLSDLGDNIWGYTHTVTEGETNGEDVLFKVKLTDDAGNFVEQNAPKTYFVDNCPVSIDSLSYVQAVDTNGNGIVDLDGTFLTEPVYATDSIRLTVNLSSQASVTVDLTQFGYGNSAYDIPVVISNSGYKAEAEIQPLRGNCNGEPVKLTVTVTDENGNQTVKETENTIKLDNKPPVITVSPITFTYDTGRIGEANKGDQIEVKVNLTGNDGLAPLLDFTKLFNANRLTPPAGTIMTLDPGSNYYTAKFTVPEGLGTKSPLAVIAMDKSGNMSIAETAPIRFMSKIPALGESAATLYYDENANGILNPGDQVRIDCYLSDGFEEDNVPPAKVVADIGSITDAEGNPFYTGSVESPEKRYWAELEYDSTGSGAGKYHYYKVFTASGTIKANRGLDADTVDFMIRVLHPESDSDTISTTTVTGSFPVDTKLPVITQKSINMSILEENGDNMASYSANIGDFLEIRAEIKQFDDAASATAVLYMPTSSEILGYVPLTRSTGTDNWIGNFNVATGTRKVGETVGLNEWRIINDGIVRLKIFATDHADNTVESALATPVPNIKMDNYPPEILADNSTFIKFNDLNVDGSPYLNVHNGVATDSMWVQVTINESLNASAGKGYAYIDLSPIGATSTYLLMPNNSGASNMFHTIDDAGLYTDRYIHFVPEKPMDIGSYSFKVVVVDAAGNKGIYEDKVKPLPLDTMRPTVSNVSYDGAMLAIKFSEKIKPTTLNVDNIRICKKTALDIDVTDGTAVNLSSTPLSSDVNDYDAVSPLTYESDTIYILLGKTSRSKVADWGNTKLYFSIASRNDDPWQIDDKLDPKYSATSIGVDIAGNWITPISRRTPKAIEVTSSYTDRPSLIGGMYNPASTEIDADYLHLTFDKAVDKSTLTEESINKLAIWYNTTSQNETWNVRYRLQPGKDTFDPGDSYNTSSCGVDSVGIKLSQEAKDWIALTYGKSATQIKLQINDSVYNPPAFIRDINGNRVNAILPGTAVTATMKPLTTPFAMTADVTLDLASKVPVLTMNFNNRRARLFDDSYPATSLIIAKNVPADLSRIYICSDERVNLGNNICLGSPGTVPAMVNWNSGATSYTTLNDFASTTVRIPLTDTALNTILTWGTSKFYVRCENGAFRDLWGNLSEPFTDTNNGAGLINTTMPSGSEYSKPRINTLAMTPVVDGLSGVTLFKGNPANTFIYEVTFETATLSSDIRVPISRSVTPVLKMFTQDGSQLDTGTFIGWGEHNQGGVTRTYVRFANSGLSESGSIQRAPVYVQVEGFTDIFRPNETFSDTASFSYNLLKKFDGTSYPNGFNQVASYPMEFDNCAPLALTATSTISGSPLINKTIGITSKNNMKVVVEFNEDMHQAKETNLLPKLKLVTSSGAIIMNYQFVGWVGTTKAEYTNAANFDSSLLQGEAFFEIGGGYDEAGNSLSDTRLPESVIVRTKGPAIKEINVKTFQDTTANSADDYQMNVAFSPSVSSKYNDDSYPIEGIATITVTFDAAPEGTSGKINIYTVDGNTLIRSLDAKQATSGLEWYAEWDGKRDDGSLITSNYQITYMIKFLDEAGNEGSKTGKIIYDNAAPKVVEWQFENLTVKNNVAYFSPVAQTAARINVITGDLSQTMKMRLSQPNVDPAQHDVINTYIMNSYGTSGYTISFNGNSSVMSTQTLDGEFKVDLVDTAGNVGVGLNSSSKPVSKLIIDRLAPSVAKLTLQRVTTDLTPVGLEGIDRFNARLHNLKIMITDNSAVDPLDDGTGIVKIMSGSTVIRRIFTSKTGADLYAVWDGNDDNGSAVDDGTYTIMVTDLAGNEAQISKEVTLIRSTFAFTTVEQIGLDSIKMTFSQKIDPATVGAAYAITPANPAGLAISNAVLVKGEDTVIIASITPALTQNQNQVEYTVTVPPETLKSVDGDSITAGNNVAKFVADTKGPAITAITYDGLSSQKQFNIVFDEQLEPKTAVAVANYQLAIGATTVPISSVILRTDNKSVTITSSGDITEGVNYTVSVIGVKDLSGNVSDTTTTFEGRDITPPVLTVTAFSSPTNERDIIIAVKANEDISGLPTAIINQTGTVANSIQLSATTNTRMFTGGYHLNSNYAGVANIKVSAVDMANNTGTANYSFTTAYVNASARASITSADKVATAVFEKGTLSANSVVMLLNEPLTKTENASASVRAAIGSTVLEGINPKLKASVRAALVTPEVDLAAEELVPVGEAYNLVVPKGRMKAAAQVRMALNAEQRSTAGIGVYQNTSKGWKLVSSKIATDSVTFDVKDGGTFALMKDTLAPRASLTNDLTKVLKSTRPTFTWNLSEYASGLDKDSIKAVIDNKEYDVMLSTEGEVVKCTPTSLNSGDHEISLKLADKAGNKTQTKSVRFAISAPLVIEDVSSYPNPARFYSKIRFKVSGNVINADEITVKIYDVAGHLVADSNNIDMRGAKGNIFEARWDLTNRKGKKVANGAYIAKIEVRDPANWNKKAKYTLKIAVLK